MEEKTSKEVNVNNLCKCPHCPCCFCGEADLKRHMEHYGDSKGAHFAEFQRVHGRLEHGSMSGPE